MNQTTQDTPNNDGTITRVTTTTFPDGSTDVKTITFTAEGYQRMLDQIAQTIADLQSQLNNGQSTMSTAHNNLKNKI